jgi:ABC-2 type transport system ATP-binding protein
VGAQAAVEFDGLTKHFGAVRALEHLDLEVREGEVLGYLGPNGAGKTTTIRLLLDHIRPTSGTARMFGVPIGSPAARRSVGYLPADLLLDPTYTAAEVFEFTAALHGAGDLGVAGALAARFELDTSRPVGELSTGNRRKVGIVRAFMLRPRLLLLDEPTSGLDPLLQHEFQQLLREAVRDGATVLLSSHVLPEVETLADRVAIMKRGRLVTVSTIDELRRHARQRIDLHLASSADPSPFRALPGVTEATAIDHTVRLVVEGGVDAVVKAAAQLEVLRVVTHDADLEDVFLSYYRDGT